MAEKDDVLLGGTGHQKFDACDIFACLALALLPFVLLAVNDNWIFLELYWKDNWIYSGFHLHLPEFLKAFGGTYYASRVPWTVLGWLSHLAFDDAHALYALHFAVFYLAVFSLYAAVRTIFANAAAAGAAALLMGTQSYIVWAVGWDYVDGPSIACLLAAVAALASTAIRPRWRLAAFMWGVATCLTVSIYILLVLFVPIHIGMFLFLNRIRAKRPVPAVAALFAIGGAATTLCLGVINWLLGGPFLYFMGQVSVLSAVADNRFKHDWPLAQWAWSAHWLLLPAIMFVFSCAYVALRARPVFKKLRLENVSAGLEILLFICCLADIAASLLFVGLEADHFYVLQVDYRANALLPFAYLIVGGALAVMIKPLPRVRQFGFLAAAAAIAILPWVLSALGRIFPRSDLFEGPTFEIGWIIAGSLLFVFVVQRPYRLGGGALMILFLSIVNLGAPAGELHYPPYQTNKQETLAALEASREIGRYNPQARARFWYNLEDSNGVLFQAVVCSYLCEYSLVSDEFPGFTVNGRRSAIVPGERIILLASKGDPIVAANAAVADQDLLLEQVAKIDIQHPGIAFSIYVADVKVDPSKYEEIDTPQPFAVELPAKISTPSRPFAFAAQISLQNQDLIGPLWIHILANIHGGPIGIGILNKEGGDFLTRTSVYASGDTTVDLLVAKPQEIGNLVIQTWDKGEPADFTIKAITVLKPRPTAESLLGKGPAPTSSDVPADADEIHDAFGPPGPHGSHSDIQAEFPIHFSTPAHPWWGPEFPLRARDLKGPLWIRIRLSVQDGPVGIGILNQAGNDFLSRILVVASRGTTVTLRVSEPQKIGDLVIQSWDRGKPGDVRVDAITVLKPHSPVAQQR